MPLPSQSHAEQNLKKPLKSSNPRPNLSLERVGPLAGLLLHAGDRGLAHYSPRLPNKAKNQESFRRDEELFVS
jgi:hypothetical protein